MKRRFGEYTIFLNGYIADPFFSKGKPTFTSTKVLHVYWLRPELDKRLWIPIMMTWIWFPAPRKIWKLDFQDPEIFCFYILSHTSLVCSFISFWRTQWLKSHWHWLMQIRTVWATQHFALLMWFFKTLFLMVNPFYLVSTALAGHFFYCNIERFCIAASSTISHLWPIGHIQTHREFQNCFGK